VRPELQPELRSALFQALELNKTAISQPVFVQFNGAPHPVIVAVRPHFSEPGTSATATGGARLALVFFLEDETLGVTGDRFALPYSESKTDDSLRLPVVPFESEVQQLHERLQAITEEYESSNEELKSANEELQSINEEYRSTTEELETSKEELQSVNEELQTVNAELKTKLAEISHAHSDLENLMASTDIATLFLNRDLRIQRYSPGTTELFNIMPSDRGRPISHLTNKLEYDNLTNDARRVLRDLASIELEVQDGTGRWLLARLRPYRTIDDRIDGVVLTFVEITERKRVEQALHESEARQALLLALGDALRPLTNWRQIQAGAARMVGKHLAADRVYYSDIREADGVAVIQADYFRDGLTSLAGEYALADFIERPGELRSGRPFVVNDVSHSIQLAEQAKASYLGRGIFSLATIPLTKNGRLVWTLNVAAESAREWSANELSLIQEVAERTWSMVERARAEEALEERVQERTAQVRRLASELVMAEQTIRQRISQTLHDNLQQMLYAMSLQIQFLDETINENEELGELRNMINQSLLLTRQLSVELAPPVLKGEGLREALDWLADHMRDFYKLHVTVRTEGQPQPIGKDEIILLYEVVRELLFNVVKHAGVQDATITLCGGDNGITISVRDEGQGFDTAVLSKTGSSLGLRTIPERLRLFDGRADIKSQPGEGTQIDLFLPYAATAVPDETEA
jgi:two-component system, chemotaxis family, CheB/CheR fusion protein